MTCAEVNEIFQNSCRSSPVPKFDYPVPNVLTRTCVSNSWIESSEAIPKYASNEYNNVEVGFNTNINNDEFQD